MMSAFFFLMSFLALMASAQTNESFSIDVSVAVFTTHPNYLSFTVDMVGFITFIQLVTLAVLPVAVEPCDKRCVWQ
jgi:hypothetical protein